MLMVREFIRVTRELTTEESCMADFLRSSACSGYNNEYISLIKDCLYNEHGYVEHTPIPSDANNVKTQYGIFKSHKGNWHEATEDERMAYYYLKTVGCPGDTCAFRNDGCDDCIFSDDCIALSSHREKCMMVCKHKEFKERE